MERAFEPEVFTRRKVQGGSNRLTSSNRIQDALLVVQFDNDFLANVFPLTAVLTTSKLS
jgi:hypothetical protein